MSAKHPGTIAWEKRKADRRRRWLEKEHARNPRCHYCHNVTTLERRGYDCTPGARPGSLHATLDHYEPLSHGGPDHPNNWRLSCYTCNSLKENMPAQQYVAELREAGVR